MAAVLYSPISAQCTRVPCINQVAGYYDHNPVAQLSACQSLFGVPVVATVTQTVPADDIFSTLTSTQTEVVIVVTTSTTYSTAEETSTAKRKVKRRGLCKHKSSSSTTISDGEHASSTTTARSSDQPPIPSNCPNLDEYSSACACIAPRTVTEYGDPSTSTIDETTTLTSASTIETVVTVGVTTVIVKAATTTVPTTLKSQTATTTTATTTVTPIPTIFNLKIYGTNEYLYLTGNNQGMAMQIGTSPATGGLISLPAGSTTAAIVGGPNYQMWGFTPVNGLTTIGRVIFQTDYYAGIIQGTWSKATCGINTISIPGSFYFYCSAGSSNRFFRCGSDVYLTANTTPYAGCVPIILTAVGV